MIIRQTTENVMTLQYHSDIQCIYRMSRKVAPPPLKKLLCVIFLLMVSLGNLTFPHHNFVPILVHLS